MREKFSSKIHTPSPIQNWFSLQQDRELAFPKNKIEQIISLALEYEKISSELRKIEKQVFT